MTKIGDFGMVSVSKGERPAKVRSSEAVGYIEIEWADDIDTQDAWERGGAALERAVLEAAGYDPARHQLGGGDLLADGERLTETVAVETRE